MEDIKEDKMKAGRELDALIDSEVMDWQQPDRGEVYKEGEFWHFKEGGLRVRTLDDGPLPHYSTQIADAWLVVEKMTSDGFCPALIFDDNGSWVMAFDGIQNLPEDDDPLITSFCIESKMIADTAQLAICLAALEAVKDKP